MNARSRLFNMFGNNICYSIRPYGLVDCRLGLRRFVEREGPWTNDPMIFKINPRNLIPGPNT